MESKNNIDKLFKDKLGNREFDIKESFLADLEGKLSAQKPVNKYRRLFFYALIALVGVSVLTYIVSTNNLDDSIDSQVSMEESKQNVVSNKVKHTEIEDVETESTEDLVDLDTDAFQEEQQKADTYTAKETLTDRINKELQQEVNKEFPDNISNHKKATKKTNTLNNKEEPSTSRNAESKAPFVNNLEKNVIVASDSQTEVKEETGNSIRSSEKVNEPGLAVKEINSNAVDFVKDSLPGNASLLENKEFDVPEMNNGNTETDAVMPTKEKPNVELVLENDSVPNEEIIDATTLASETILSDSLVLEKEISEEFSDTLSKDDSLANTEVLIPEDSSETFKKWTFSVFGGPSLINKNLTGVSSAAYLAKRNDEETNIVSMSYGLRMNYSFNEKINISLGANSLTYGEDVNYSTIYSTSESIGSVSKDSSYLEYIYTAVPDTINGGYDTTITTIIVDTTFMVDTTIINVNATDYAGKNRFTYLQIPIMFGYKFTFNKLSVNVRLGGSYGILLKNTGSYVDNNVSNIELPNLRKTMINMVASTTIGYQLKKMNVFIEPKFRLNSGSIITHPEIKQRYTSIGCNFGLSFDF